MAYLPTFLVQVGKNLPCRVVNFCEYATLFVASRPSLYPDHFCSGQPRHASSPCKIIARILLSNSNQWHFNNLVKRPCHKTLYRCPHRLNLSSQSSRSCALPNIKALKDKDLEFANSIRPFAAHMTSSPILVPNRARKLSPQINVELVVGLEVFRRLVHTASGHGVFCPTPLMPSMT